MRSMHARAAFCGRRVGDKKATSNKTPVNKCISGLVGTICLVGGIVCRWPSILQAATVPLSGVPFGKYVKVGSADYISGHELACQPGSDFCGEGSAWNNLTQSCTGGKISVSTMQTFSSTLCDMYVTPADTDFTYIGELTDTRDGQTYQIRKYADGHCWMAQNLRYGNCDNYTASDFSTYASTTNYNLVASGYYGACYSDGTNYRYNWQAAVNDANCYYNVNADPSASQGICPTGWHLPSQQEASTLSARNGGSGGHCANASCPDFVTFLTHGSWNSTLLDANWWERRQFYYQGQQLTQAYVFHIDRSNNNATWGVTKNSGQLVRCLADY